MLGLLIWNRPYERRSGNVINIFIQIVRALSVVCILVFVEELGIAQTTQTVTGVVLIVVQSLLTGVLAILIAANAIIMCCKENPHRKRRKEAGMCSSNFFLLKAQLTLPRKTQPRPRQPHSLRCPQLTAHGPVQGPNEQRLRARPQASSREAEQRRLVHERAGKPILRFDTPPTLHSHKPQNQLLSGKPREFAGGCGASWRCLWKPATGTYFTKLAP